MGGFVFFLGCGRRSGRAASLAVRAALLAPQGTEGEGGSRP
nr:MAG TPA: hypothetical protein [Caudoviricetes sp.]